MGVVYNQRETNFETHGFPGLVFDFARAGNQRDGISKRTDYISIGRTSIGTYVGPDGLIKTAAAFEPRFDYDPLTGKCNGLLIEGSRTNRFNNSLFGGSWTLFNSATRDFNAGIAPDGTNTAVMLTCTNSYESHVNYVINGSNNSLSVYVKKGTKNSLSIVDNSSNFYARINIYNWTVAESVNCTINIVPYPNNWYRILVSNITQISNYVKIGEYSNYSPGFESGTVYLWGAQLEAASFPTTYIPTTSAAVTRGADNPIIITPSFYNSSTSSIILQYKPLVGSATTQPLLSFDDNTTNNEIKALVAGTSPTLTVVNAGVTTVSISTNPRVSVVNQEYGVSLSAKDNQFTLTSEGVGVISSTSGALPVGISTMRIGHDKAGNAFNGYISKLIYYPKELETPALKIFSDVSYQGKIVTDGLVLHLDAANRKSYPGSGTVWYDRAGNNNGELVNSPIYNSSNLGYFQFVTDDFARIPNNTALDTQTPTVEVWVKTNNTNQNGFWFEKGTVNTQYSLFQNGASISWRMFIGGAITQLTVATATYMNTSNWYQVVGTYTSGSRILYINGVQVNSDTQSGTIDTNSGGMSIGVYGGYSGSRGYYYNGNLAVCRVYNKVLTATEIQQNFNALRGRFGI